MDRVILHCDCNSFFASVECLRDPSLWSVPMAVCGSVASPRLCVRLEMPVRRSAA